MDDALTLIHRLSRTAVEADDAHTLLEAMTREALAAVGADRAFIALANEDSGELNLVATAGDGWTDERRALRLKIREGGVKDDGQRRAGRAR